MNIEIRHTEPRDSIPLQEIYAQIEAIMGTLQIPYPTESAWKQRLESLPPGSLSLVAEVDGKVVGNAAIVCRPSSPRRRHVGELGMAIHRDWRRRGVGAALLGALIDTAENWLNLSRIELAVFVDNTAAVALYEKFGFVIEGTHRHYAFRNGELADSHSMARIRQDAS